MALPPSPGSATPAPSVVVGGESRPVDLPPDSTVGTSAPAPGVALPALTPELPAQPVPPAGSAVPSPAGPALAAMPIQPETPLESTEPVTPSAMAPVPLPAPRPLQAQATPRPQPAGTADLRRLQGTWSVLALELDSIDHEPDPDSAVLFAGNALVFVWGAKDRGEKSMTIEPGTFTIDVDHQPGWIDVTPTQDGPARQGIYRIEGPLLLFCLAEQGRPRPTAFDTAPDSGQFLFVLRRKRTPDPSRITTPAGRIGREIHLRIGSPGTQPGPGMIRGMPGMQGGPMMGPSQMGPGQPRPQPTPAPSPAANPAPQPLPSPRAEPAPAPTPSPGTAGPSFGT